MKLCILFLCLSVAATFFMHCEARRSLEVITRSSKRPRISVVKQPKKLRAVKHTFLGQMMEHLDLAQPLDSSNTQSYGVSSPFTLPPYESLSPIPLPENAPPYCIYPPNTPQPPSTVIPTPGYGNTPPSYMPPTLPIQNPPPGPTLGSPPGTTPNPNPPESVPSPFVYIPGPSGPSLSPPFYEPSPPSFTPSPPSGIPSPTGHVPSPRSFLPPIVYPPPTAPPPPNMSPSMTLWCVAKPSVPDPIIQEAMNYACGSGADCNSIQPNGPCFQPNTLFAHASFAFNSYWQKTKAAGGTCEFGGTAILVTVDPSYDGCHFVYS